MLEHSRVLQLALKGLEAERQRLDEEMATIQRELKGTQTRQRPVWPLHHQTDAPQKHDQELGAMRKLPALRVGNRKLGRVRSALTSAKPTSGSMAFDLSGQPVTRANDLLQSGLPIHTELKRIHRKRHTHGKFRGFSLFTFDGHDYCSPIIQSLSSFLSDNSS